MQLSPHFSLDEMTKSQTAARKGIDNTAPPEVIEHLKGLCVHVLEPLRFLAIEQAGAKNGMHVSSGYRSPELNAEAGGAKDSQHMKGEAADIEVPGLSTLALATLLANSQIPFDQMICEFYTPGVPTSGWVHVSYAASGHQRRQVLTASRGAKGTIYTAGLPK